MNVGHLLTLLKECDPKDKVMLGSEELSAVLANGILTLDKRAGHGIHALPHHKPNHVYLLGQPK